MPDSLARSVHPIRLGIFEPSQSVEAPRSALFLISGHAVVIVGPTQAPAPTGTLFSIPVDSEDSTPPMLYHICKPK